MTDLKTQHLLTLAHILSKGGKYNFVNITTVRKFSSKINYYKITF